MKSENKTFNFIDSQINPNRNKEESLKCRMCLKEINPETSADGVCRECWGGGD
jgi:hypothetical protein